MRAIALSLGLAVLTSLAGAQVTSRFNETIGALASALADNNAPEFLSYFDRKMPGYSRLKTNVEALLNQANVHSGIDQISESGNEVDVDWAIDLSVIDEPEQTENRRARVHLRFEKIGKSWKVVSIDQLDLFAPPKIRAR